MRILFVCSGNSTKFPISPFIISQASSIEKLGHSIEFFFIRGKGVFGYLANVRKLRSYILQQKFDIIHAHYSLSALVSVLAFSGKPVVCSYMGNDILGLYDAKGYLRVTSIYLILISLLIQPFLKHAICKSINTSKIVFFTKFTIIPNGVNLSQFKPQLIERKDSSKKVLFLGDPDDLNKNITLLYAAIKLISDIQLELVAPYPIAHDSLPQLYNEADVLVLCSIVEGSPNVVKEAMASNCPIIATEAGDVKWLLGNTEGHFVIKHDPRDLADKLELVLKRGYRSQGRDRLLKLGLDSESVAKKIEFIYMKSLER